MQGLNTLRLIIVEDSPDDAELICIELERAGYQTIPQRVETELEMAEALKREDWDIVISDFNLPGFSALKAFQMIYATRRDIPFILVSGCIGEEKAVEMMRAGVNDYVMKANLHRLAPAVEREIKDAAIRHKRREAELALRESEQRFRELSAFLQTVREEDRAHFARELHDELGQSLTALRIDLNWLSSQFANSGPQVDAKLEGMKNVLAQTVDSVRRICDNLRPGMLDDLGIEAALESHAQKFSEQTGIPCDLALESEDLGLDDQVSTALFRIFQETLTNVARHSGARRVHARLHAEDGLIRLTVKDDGCGLPEAPPKRKTYGLMGMTERARMLGGQLIVDSPPGQGTRIEVVLPRQVEAQDP